MLCGLIGSALGLGACARGATAAAPSAAAPSAASPSAAAPGTGGCLPTHDGYLRVRLRGAANLDIDWRDGDLQCDGGPRPDQRGLRVTFAGPVSPGGHHLRFVFGIAGARKGGAAHDLPVNVTVIFEGEPKLYSTRGEDKCTIDELTEAPEPELNRAERLRVTARGFCVSPAAAADGGAGLLLSRFDFAGAVLYENEPHDEAASRT